MNQHAGKIYIGIGSHVVAIDTASGEEIWRCKLKRASYVTISVHPDGVYAGASGELFCVDPVTGSIRWRNYLSGLGMGLVTFGESTAAIAGAAADAAAAAAAGAG